MTFLSIFSTREIVSAIYLSCFVLYGITKKTIRSSFSNVIKVFFCWKIIIPILVLLFYGYIPIFLVRQLKFWKRIYLKDIWVWLIFVGIPFCLNVSAAKEKSYFKNIILNNLKLVVVVEFITSSFTFNYIIEFLLQPILLFLYLVQYTAEAKKEYKKIANIINGIMSFIGFFILISSLKIAIQSLTKENELDLLISFFIPIIYSILFLPCAYLLALYSEYEQLYVRMKVVYKNTGMIKNGNKRILNYRFFRIVKELGLSLNNLLLIDSSLLLAIYSEEENEFDLFIKKLHKIKEKNKMNKKPLFDRTGMKILQFIISVVAVTIASLSYIPQIKAYYHKPIHNIEITIPDFKVNENNFVIPMIFKNEGDYDEILTSISLDFFNGDSHVLQLAETDDIFLFQKKSNYTKIFETKIDFKDKDKFLYEYFLSNKLVSLELIFEFTVQENKHVTTRIKLGDVLINEDLRKFDMQISVPSKEVDFSNAKEIKIIENYPRTTDFDSFDLVERKQ